MWLITITIIIRNVTESAGIPRDPQFSTGQLTPLFKQNKTRALLSGAIGSI